AGDVGEHRAGGVEHRRMLHQLAAGWRASEQPAGTAGAESGELVAPARRGLEPGREFGAGTVEEGGRDETLDDGAALGGEPAGDLGRGGGGGKARYRHAASPTTARAYARRNSGRDAGEELVFRLLVPAQVVEPLRGPGGDV